MPPAANLRKIPDDRQLGRPTPAYVRFHMERYASGDFKNISIGEGAKLVSSEWKALSANEKKVCVFDSL